MQDKKPNSPQKLEVEPLSPEDQAWYDEMRALTKDKPPNISVTEYPSRYLDSID